MLIKKKTGNCWAEKSRMPKKIKQNFEFHKKKFQKSSKNAKLFEFKKI